MAVPQNFPNYLRLHVEELPAPPPALAAGQPLVERLCRAFRRATGWNLTLRPGAPPAAGKGALWRAPLLAPNGRVTSFLQLERAASRKDAHVADPVTARLLADGVSALLGELAKTQRALWEREAELAAGVPVCGRREDAAALAMRLEAALAGGARAAGCDAAALYLLDEATAELKLRSAWNLPPQRFTEPPRPLAGQVADLEALLGQAVVLEDAALLPAWKAPEDFPAAVCVPVSTNTAPLGTLWAFSRQQRPFSDHDTNMLEITAGRIAVELERQVLLAEVEQHRRAPRQPAAVDPQVAPPPLGELLDGWEAAGWCADAERAGRVWCDWFLTDDNRLLLAACATPLVGWEATLAGQAARAALRALGGQKKLSLAQLVERWQTAVAAVSAADPQWRLWLGRVDAKRRRLEFAAQGPVCAWLGRGRRTLPVNAGRRRGGKLSQESSPVYGTQDLLAGDTLLVTLAPEQACHDRQAAGGELAKAARALLRTGGKQSAQRVAEALRALPLWGATACDCRADDSPAARDRVGLVLKGRTS